MHLTITIVLPLLIILLPLTTAQQGTDANGCQTFEPSSAYQIYSSYPDFSTNATISDFNIPSNTSNSTTRFASPKHIAARSRSRSRSRRAAQIPFIFYVSKDDNNTNYQDLVVAFTNLPCGGPGPFSFEFNFAAGSAYFTGGQDQVNMFRVNTDHLAPNPTYDTIEPLTGSLIGTFELPSGGAAEPRVIFLNQLVCESEVVLRFGISRYSSGGGSVAYINHGGMGLRERNGC